MLLITSAEHSAEMRRLGRMRNEAIRHHDLSAELAIKLKVREVDRIFGVQSALTGSTQAQKAQRPKLAG